MGMVISLPVSRHRPVRVEPSQPRQPGKVVILPVIRIERFCEQPADLDPTGPRSQGRKRRRRASRP